MREKNMISQQLLIEDRRFYVYVYLNILKPGVYIYNHKYGAGWMYEPFYVGKGKNKRMYDHIKEAKKYSTSTEIKGNELKINQINKIFNNGTGFPILIVEDNLTEKQAYELEKQLIAKFGRVDKKTGCLTNMTSGGEGFNNPVFSLKRKENEMQTKYNNPEILRKMGEKRKLFNKNNPEKEKLRIYKSKKSRIKNKSQQGTKHPRYVKIEYEFIITNYFNIVGCDDLIKKYNNVFSTPIGNSSYGRFLKILNFPSNVVRYTDRKIIYLKFVEENKNKIQWYIDNYERLEEEYYENKWKEKYGDFDK
jgi:hypothetical protein